MVTVPASSSAVKLPASVLALLTIAAAMILPSVHVWMHGADTLVAAHVERARAAGRIPSDFLYVAQQVAENRVQAQGLIDAITATGTLVIVVLATWLLARWRTLRLPMETAISIASLALLAEMGFYVLLYVVVWLTLGSDAMTLSWHALIPTDLSRLAPSGSLLRGILATLTLGAGVRFVTLALTLRRNAAELSAGNTWLVAGGASLLVVTFGVFLQQI